MASQIAAWKEGASASDETACMMSPLDIIEEMNRQFDDAIITTDVSQHMMLVSQLCGDYRKEAACIVSGGLGDDGYMDSRRRSEHRSVIRRNE